MHSQFLFLSVISVIAIFLCSTSSAQNITVTWTGGWNCRLAFLDKNFQCALGENGAAVNTQEGDGKTPIGAFPLRRAFYRADRMNSSLPFCYNTSSYLNCEATQENYGWVDDGNDPFYNQFVLLPYPAHHEELYLQSSVYDLFAVIGYNDDPIVPFAGSAIFFHVASEGYGATAGCVSMALEDLSFVLSRVSVNTYMIIQASEQ
jgi:L,D-peptidoglycan transpeptidase YkuD (ErfK/YbiS/YcfS/YnhG family)